MGQGYEIAMETDTLDKYWAGRRGRDAEHDKQMLKSYIALSKWLISKANEFEERVRKDIHDDDVVLKQIADKLERYITPNNYFNKYCWYRKDHQKIKASQKSK